ncbi:hypothetical protein ACFPZ0_02670 [Streptomonospora nanhaiensis]|uniref:Type I restriction enzyme R protein N-terminal domain-containing protein n=1 Tax=Streptomonospora nanhaiensis TaxID=1323731 RepID=A0A853BQX4_9ACTN|nr:hypothetical protein [Streptomonospora nanhaiensis]MBV2367100.1 hypothetical protein [Streptomonospora nanhaiensis]MBX9386815.1 hypothetical protein [Streptomonospora nanhaiensis]NYI98119.1 hypothetical protein [Streptomonospora nanhaiensis]
MDPDATQILNRTVEITRQGDTAPAWEVAARARLNAAIERFTGPLADLLARDANEGDTRLLVTDFLSDGLNFSKYGDLTTEYRTKGESVDYGITLGDTLFAFIEVKPCGARLDPRGLRQARLHAAERKVAWAVLTNGRVWQAHHLGDGGEDAGTGLVVDVDLLSEAPLHERVDALLPLTREAVERGRLETLRAWRAALEPGPLAAAAASPPVVAALRAELLRRTGHEGHIGDTAETARALTEGVVKKGLL